MSEPSYLECMANLRDAAYDMAKTYYEREPTEEEIEEEMEYLVDRYR
jgi:hypothetical protein